MATQLSQFPADLLVHEHFFSFSPNCIAIVEGCFQVLNRLTIDDLGTCLVITLTQKNKIECMKLSRDKFEKADLDYFAIIGLHLIFETKKSSINT